MIDLLAAVKAPEIDYLGFAPMFALIGGAIVVLIAGLFPGRFVQRSLVPQLAATALVVAIVFSVANWEPGTVKPIISGALSIDALALFMSILFYVAGLAAIALSLRSSGGAQAGRSPGGAANLAGARPDEHHSTEWSVQEAGAGEYYALLLGSIAGMTLLAGAENLVTLFVGLELLSIPLYVLCASSVRDRKSLESGLKYLVVGSVGSATLLYGLALVYGATGHTDLSGISAAIGDTVKAGDPLLLTGVALAVVGLAFKASVAPFHQWTPDVYQGAPTPVTAFMAVATKAAAFAIVLRLFGGTLLDLQDDWAPALAALATATILIGNAGAVVQRSLKRLLGWSGVAQAGYMLAGVVVGTQLGLQATVFYLAAYLVMNVAAFAVVIARERVSEHGDDIESLRDLSRSAPLLAWPITIAMLGLAGFPATAGFIGKFYLIDATVAGDYAWLGIVIVVGSMISLAYYLRVVAIMWMDRIEITLPTTPPRTVKAVKGWSPEADPRAVPEITAVALLAAAATIFLGLYPSPLFDVVKDVGTSLASLL